MAAGDSPYTPTDGAALDPTQVVPPGTLSASDKNQINGWTTANLGRNFSDADFAALNGQPLGAIQNGIANSPEAIAYAKANSASPAAPPPPAAAAPAPGSTWTPSAPVGGLQDPQSSAFYDMLLSKASATPNVDPNNPVIAGQVNAYGATQQRTNRDALAALAERGGPNTNLGAETRLAAERAGSATSGFQATLQSQEIASQRAEIQQALQLGAQFLTAQQQMTLQQKLKDLDLQQATYDRQERAYEYDQTNAFQSSPFAPGAVA